MNTIRKALLRSRYLKARSVIERLDASCGETLLRHISTEADSAYREMEAIEAEVKQAIAEESHALSL